MADGKVKVVVVGCGRMGALHANAYNVIPGFKIVGLVNRGVEKRESLSKELGGVPHFATLAEALEATKPNAAAICTYTDQHAPLAIQCLEAGVHVFLEKPLAATVQEGEAVVRAAREKQRAVVVGYILRHHPTWQDFIARARECGKPLVMRMNLNQQSDGAAWVTHKAILQGSSPLVDVGVHYLDVMCQMTGANPTSVYAIGANLSDELPRAAMNYGQLQVRFDDGSIGWFESGLGPMISQSGYNIKDVFGPLGSVSLVPPEPEQSKPGAAANFKSHTGTGGLRVHRSQLKPDGTFAGEDEWFELPDEPSQPDLCKRQQEYFLRAVTEGLDLTQHWADAVNSLRVCLAAEDSARTGEVAKL